VDFSDDDYDAGSDGARLALALAGQCGGSDGAGSGSSDGGLAGEDGEGGGSDDDLGWDMEAALRSYDKYAGRLHRNLPAEVWARVQSGAFETRREHAAALLPFYRAYTVEGFKRANVQPRREVRLARDVQAHPGAKAQAQTRAEAKAQARAEAKAKAQAQAEAKAQAQAEAEAQAEATGVVAILVVGLTAAQRAVGDEKSRPLQFGQSSKTAGAVFCRTSHAVHARDGAMAIFTKAGEGDLGALLPQAAESAAPQVAAAFERAYPGVGLNPLAHGTRHLAARAAAACSDMSGPEVTPVYFLYSEADIAKRGSHAKGDPTRRATNPTSGEAAVLLGGGDATGEDGDTHYALSRHQHRKQESPRGSLWWSGDTLGAAASLEERLRCVLLASGVHLAPPLTGLWVLRRVLAPTSTGLHTKALVPLPPAPK
jgi:hypothetical protein